ncbi:CobN component of cobalt chelatase involved in B12 biosynthesis [invertebrate metagenome]|uniref:CobN component of cobalt chelatase involved in B12 biosynthesis n=1 Tax=invertebrate metagenome TaxID=1711999 RepID=A0A484H777_9ZZZZ
MHLLAATPGIVTDGAEAIDLGQTPGEVILLSAADTELSCLAAAHRQVNAFTLRLANLLRLGHPLSVDLYGEHIIAYSRLVVVRLLGGRSYWPYGVEQISALCRQHTIPVAFLPGDDQPDDDLATFSTVPAPVSARLWQYLVYGGAANARQFLYYTATLIGRETEWQEPVPLPLAGLYSPDSTTQVPWKGAERAGGSGRTPPPTAVVIFYRALLQGGDTAAIDALTDALVAEGFNPLLLFVTSLKDPLAAMAVREILVQSPPDIILNTTSFAVTAPGGETHSLTMTPAGSKTVALPPFAYTDCPVLQVVFAGSSEETWRVGSHGLSARDIAMNVALPEIDGRLLTRAVAFKGSTVRDRATECDLVISQPVLDRVTFTAQLAGAWVRLRHTPAAARRVVLILANYPNRDGRIGNGVGLDTPATTVNVLKALAAAGYQVTDSPSDSAALLDRLLASSTNNVSSTSSDMTERLSVSTYQDFLARQPERVRRQVWKRWGAPERDPFMRCDLHFRLPVVLFGHVAVAIQPARGYNIDPAATYHDPSLVPPHNYLAFYAWIREVFAAHAIVQIGKHGNLEWLPGKSVALSETCFPEVALGSLPHLYPFIVNDPGEGTQAKRRAAAVIVDHLTPPLTRAESYGPLLDLEQHVDEYYEAAILDPRRCKVLKDDILSMIHVLCLDKDLGLTAADDDDTTLVRLDAHLCALKELQIRDGLHIFGQSPGGDQRLDLLVALARVPRGSAPHEASLLRALADDLVLGLDPLDDAASIKPWQGPWPSLLRNGPPWRTVGDTVERLEGLALAMVGGVLAVDITAWPHTAPVIEWIRNTLAPTVDSCGAAEMAGLLQGLEGRFVMAGPSGAPTRGRPDVLPTGRNFYSVDTRVVPTPAAWTLGWRSATMLMERHLQEHGEWPQTVALTAWGTSNMRTGGDDIAQGLAFMGVRPTWEPASRRVTGFEILPVSVLDRPRVDVTLRVSGFFRDAFPSLIELFDTAAQAVAALDEPAAVNPLAAQVRADVRRFTADGVAPHTAWRQASHRVFGSQPGAYGAGLQTLIDEKEWETDTDLAHAYIGWGGYAYGAADHGTMAHELFRDRLKAVDAVVQNQDNREHDLLDSDDYYQFEGGLTAAVRVLSGGKQPKIYHTDHSRPETPRIHTLNEEIARIVRGRAANPKWIRGVMRHGYKGAFEMAATVDYLFAFSATTHCVSDHHFDLLFDAYLGDETVRAFIAESNPHALREMSDRFGEALKRGLWRPRRNDVHTALSEIGTSSGTPPTHPS